MLYSWIKKTGLDWSLGPVSVGEPCLQAMNIKNSFCYGGHFQHTLSSSTLRPEGKLRHSQGVEALESLIWLCLCQQHRLTRDFLHSPHGFFSVSLSLPPSFVSFTYTLTLNDCACCSHEPVCVQSGSSNSRSFLPHSSSYCLETGPLTEPGHHFCLDRLGSELLGSACFWPQGWVYRRQPCLYLCECWGSELGSSGLRSNLSF